MMEIFAPEILDVLMNQQDLMETGSPLMDFCCANYNHVRGFSSERTFTVRV